MNKLLILPILLFFLYNCTTTRNYEKYTSDDCIIVIPTESISPSDKKMARTFYLNISGLDYKIAVPNDPHDILLVKVRNNSHKIISLTSKITNENFKGKSSSEDMNLKLPYVPGEVVISDFKIIHKMEEVEDNSYSSCAYMHPLTDEEKDELSESITKNPKLESWFN